MDESKFKIGDKVCKRWKPGDVGEVADVIINSQDPQHEFFVYRVHFTNCTGMFLEDDLVAAS